MTYESLFTYNHSKNMVNVKSFANRWINRQTSQKLYDPNLSTLGHRKTNQSNERTPNDASQCKISKPYLPWLKLS
jgi:hypothetical protein